jgi:hypothetical protein
MGGYIEDAQIAQLGLEIYQEIHGDKTFPDKRFVIPNNNYDWPVHLWGYELGKGVDQHIKKFLVDEEKIIGKQPNGKGK